MSKDKKTNKQLVEILRNTNLLSVDTSVLTYKQLITVLTDFITAIGQCGTLDDIETFEVLLEDIELVDGRVTYDEFEKEIDEARSIILDNTVDY